MHILENVTCVLPVPGIVANTDLWLYLPDLSTTGIYLKFQCHGSEYKFLLNPLGTKRCTYSLQYPTVLKVLMIPRHESILGIS